MGATKATHTGNIQNTKGISIPRTVSPNSNTSGIKQLTAWFLVGDSVIKQRIIVLGPSMALYY